MGVLALHSRTTRSAQLSGPLFLLTLLATCFTVEAPAQSEFPSPALSTLSVSNRLLVRLLRGKVQPLLYWHLSAWLGSAAWQRSTTGPC